MSLVQDLLEQACVLVKIDREGRSLAAKGRPRQADLRRAVSTAYYAVFHAITERVVAEVLSAKDVNGPWGNRLRRSISHATVLKIAKWFVQEKPGSQIPEAVRALRDALDLEKIDPRFSRFCRSIKELQEERHRADYDLGESFTKKEAKRLVLEAVNTVATIREFQSHGDVRLFFLACVVGDFAKNA